MIAMIYILALVLEPIGPITDEPFIYGVDSIEVIEEAPLEEIERKMRLEEIKQRYRVMENRDADR